MNEKIKIKTREQKNVEKVEKKEERNDEKKEEKENQTDLVEKMKILITIKLRKDWNKDTIV